MSHHKTCPNHPKYDQCFPGVRIAVQQASNRITNKLTNLKSSKILFFPWVGERYDDPNHPGKLFNDARILILGESHYEWCEECNQNQTNRDYLTVLSVVDRMAEVDPSFQHWKKVENAFVGGSADREERKNFWHSVTYYNFLQKLIPFRQEPTPNDYLNATQPFLNILNLLGPTHVVVLGKRLWGVLDRQIQANHLNSLVVEGKEVTRKQYNTICMCGIAHPAAGLGATWQAVIDKVIN